MQLFTVIAKRRWKPLDKPSSNVKIHHDRTSDKKVMAFDKSCTKAILSAWPGPTPKRCELPLFLAALGQAMRGWKALGVGSLNMQFQQDWPKDKQITALSSFCRKT